MNSGGQDFGSKTIAMQLQDGRLAFGDHPRALCIVDSTVSKRVKAVDRRQNNCAAARISTMHIQLEDESTLNSQESFGE